jgi:dihydrofolate reductase
MIGAMSFRRLIRLTGVGDCGDRPLEEEDWMRDVIVTENITLDGVANEMEHWFSPFGADDIAATNREHMAAADGVLLGRVTYEEFKGFWPQQTDDPTGVSGYLNRTQKYVFSSTLTAVDWENTTILRGPLAQEIAALKQQPGNDIVTAGSISLAQSLLREGLADEVRLFVYPVYLGRGRRLFPDGAERKLRLTDTRSFRSGVVLLTYRPAPSDDNAG